MHRIELCTVVSGLWACYTSSTRTQREDVGNPFTTVIAGAFGAKMEGIFYDHRTHTQELQEDKRKEASWKDFPRLQDTYECRAAHTSHTLYKHSSLRPLIRGRMEEVEQQDRGESEEEEEDEEAGPAKRNVVASSREERVSKRALSSSSRPHKERFDSAHVLFKFCVMSSVASNEGDPPRGGVLFRNQRI